MTKETKISVIIPCLNEEENLRKLIPHLLKNSRGLLEEIIVCDGGSSDNTAAVCNSFGIKVINSAVCSRAVQMNLGAKHATGDILYFVHADTMPIEGYLKVILESIAGRQEVGCFRYRFDSENPLLKLNSWFTRFNGFLSGGGDQTLFIQKSFFNSLYGFDETYCIMEDFDLVRRIRQKSDFHVLPYVMTVSDRKYKENTWLRIQVANLTAFSLFMLKVKPATIKSLYLKLLRKRSIGLISS